MTELDDDSSFAEGHLTELTHTLRSMLGWVRHPAVEELAGVDFEQFERPPQLGLLIAALNAPELRDRARDSLARALRGLAPEDLRQLGRDDRRILRESMKWSRPQVHADYLVEVSQTLLRIGDINSIPALANLVERTTIRQFVVEKYRRGQGTDKRIERSFQGTPAEEHEVRRVRSAAHVACERLRLLAEKLAPGDTLLHPAPPPAPEDLLRPASHTPSDSTLLLHPAPGRDGPE